MMAMRLIDRLRTTPTIERSTVDDLAQWFGFAGWNYPMLGRTGTGGTEELQHSFVGYVDAALKSNGIVYACVAARTMLFSEVTFKWRDLETRNLFGDGNLTRLERPGQSRTTQEMLALHELDVSFAGNSYWVADGDGVRRLRPDWVGIVTGDPAKDGQRSSDLLGYTYTDGGPGRGEKPEIFLPDEVSHFSPMPDPSAQHRGMSWITPIVREIQADTGFTDHRRSFVKNGAVPQFAVKYPPLSEDQFHAAVANFRSLYEGSANSGRNIHVSGGADIVPLTVDLRQMDFKAVQGGGETRIAAAARVPAIIAQISEGLAGSSLNAGNYGMARRQFGDLFARPAWRSVCGSLSTLLTPPAGSVELWYDESDISFLREDQKDAAEVIERKAAAMRQLVDGGFEPKSVIAAVDGGDMSQLKETGLLSVQLQPPGAAPVGMNSVPMTVGPSQLASLVAAGWQVVESRAAGGDQPSANGVPALTEGGN